MHWNSILLGLHISYDTCTRSYILYEYNVVAQIETHVPTYVTNVCFHNFVEDY